VFDPVAEGSRRGILDLLAVGPRAVGQRAAETGLSQPAEFEPRVDGLVAWHPEGHVPDMPENEVTDWDPRSSSATPESSSTIGRSPL
jgi:hypothetical protein